MHVHSHLLADDFNLESAEKADNDTDQGGDDDKVEEHTDLLDDGEAATSIATSHERIH